MAVCNCRVKHTGNYTLVEHKAGQSFKGWQYHLHRGIIAQKLAQL